MPFDKKLVFVAGFEETQCRAIVAASGTGGPPLRLEPLRQGDADRLVGAVVEEALAETSSRDAERPMELCHPLLFFALFPRSEIDTFVETVKACVPRRAILAALTPTNMTWTFGTLVEHLLEEHEHVIRLEARDAVSGEEAPQ
ncbi:MAG: DUF3783 domain-containing protein [Myxococcota bacterium]|jgi:hypothetical protein|nr:DUF3783 domain-containing protein [Myxococcota bacterium]